MPVETQKRIRETLKAGELSKHGYAMSANVDSRHRALAKAVDEDGASTVAKRLNLLFVWNKDKNPRLARVAKADRNWVGRRFGVEVDGFRFK